MFRFLYYKGFINLIDKDMLIELKKDIELDYKNDIIEPHQYELLKQYINEKLNNKVLYI